MDMKQIWSIIIHTSNITLNKLKIWETVKGKIKRICRVKNFVFNENHMANHAPSNLRTLMKSVEKSTCHPSLLCMP